MKIEEQSAVVVLHQPSVATLAKKKWLNPFAVSPGSGGINAQSSFTKTVKHLLCWDFAHLFHIFTCMPSLYSFISIFHSFYASHTSSLSTYYVFHFLLFSFSHSLQVFQSCCPLINVLDFFLSPFLPFSISVPLFLREQSVTLFNQSVCPWANPARYKASSSSSSSSMGTNQ